MSLRERAIVDITDVLNESDDSDQECMLNHVYLREEIDIANFYRKLCYRNRLNNHWNMKQKSVTVQTDPEISNIPPSWLIEGENLVDQLYTGLGNIINSVYNNPQSGDKEDAMKRANLNTSGMKYFTFENGYWRSTLIPSIKIPDLKETNTRNKFLCSDDTKSRLIHLLDIATKLRYAISNVSDLSSVENITSNDKIQQSTSSNAEPLSEFGKSQLRNGISNYNIDKTNAVDDLAEIWSELEEPMVCRQEYCDVRKPLTKRTRKDSVHEVVRKKHVVLDDGCRSGEIPGVKVMRYALSSRDPNTESKVVRELRKEDNNAKNSKSNFSSGKTCATNRPVIPIEVSVLPSCSKARSKIHQCDGSRAVTSLSKREKRPLYDQENCIKSKSNRGNSEKDFIRKNILDLKNKYNRSTSAVVKNYRSDIGTESSGMTKNGHRMKS